MENNIPHRSDYFENHLEIIKKIDALLESYEQEKTTTIPSNEKLFGEKPSNLYKPWNLYFSESIPFEGGLLVHEKKQKKNEKEEKKNYKKNLKKKERKIEPQLDNSKKPSK